MFTNIRLRDDLSTNHGGIIMFAAANIQLSVLPLVSPPSFELLCPRHVCSYVWSPRRHLLTCFATCSVAVFWRPVDYVWASRYELINNVRRWAKKPDTETTVHLSRKNYVDQRIFYIPTNGKVKPFQTRSLDCANCSSGGRLSRKDRPSVDGRFRVASPGPRRLRVRRSAPEAAQHRQILFKNG